MSSMVKGLVRDIHAKYLGEQVTGIRCCGSWYSCAHGSRREVHRPYLMRAIAARTPVAVKVLDLIKGLNHGAPIMHDHMAFRTFGVRVSRW